MNAWESFDKHRSLPWQNNRSGATPWETSILPMAHAQHTVNVQASSPSPSHSSFENLWAIIIETGQVRVLRVITLGHEKVPWPGQAICYTQQKLTSQEAARWLWDQTWSPLIRRGVRSSEVWYTEALTYTHTYTHSVAKTLADFCQMKLSGGCSRCYCKTSVFGTHFPPGSAPSSPFHIHTQHTLKKVHYGLWILVLLSLQLEVHFFFQRWMETAMIASLARTNRATSRSKLCHVCALRSKQVEEACAKCDYEATLRSVSPL